MFLNPSLSKLPHKFSLFSGSPFLTIPAEISSGGYPDSSKMLNLKRSTKALYGKKGVLFSSCCSSCVYSHSNQEKKGGGESLRRKLNPDWTERTKLLESLSRTPTHLHLYLIDNQLGGCGNSSGQMEA